MSALVLRAKGADPKTLSSPGCAVGLGQARPPEPGEAFAAFPFMQLHTLPAVPATSDRPAPPIPLRGRRGTSALTTRSNQLGNWHILLLESFGNFTGYSGPISALSLMALTAAHK